MEPIVLNHPIVEHKLTVLRDKKTGTKEFREIAGELATLLCYEAMKDAELEEVEIGMYRNEETLEPVEYYFKVPKEIENREVLVLDPMLATGGTAVDAISQLKKRGVKKIKFLSIIAAPEGIKKVQQVHSDVQIYCATIDSNLNDVGYIVPGLGDAGDRIYGTK